MVGSEHALTGRDKKIDDLGWRHIEQRRNFAAGMNGPVQVNRRRRERHAEIARAVLRVAALDGFAAQEERRGDDRLVVLDGGAHDTPRTYASTVPAQPILSSPSRSA